jgi:DNA-binding SARP family transcriptional activator
VPDLTPLIETFAAPLKASGGLAISSDPLDALPAPALHVPRGVLYWLGRSHIAQQTLHSRTRRQILSDGQGVRDRRGVLPLWLTRSTIEDRRGATSLWLPDPEVAKPQPRPLPVQIRTLGRFGITLEGQRLAFSGKAPKKPLEVLKALIAFGGREVDIDEIMSAVWPALGRSARASFDVSLMRLRKILGRPECLILDDGMLSVNDTLCWVDVWTFENAVDRLEAGGDARDAALGLFRGRFLEREGEARWIINTRDRLSSKFRRAVMRVAHREELAQRWESAIDLYRLALERDNLVEDFHCRLMRAEWRLGKRADAIRTYRRCCELLSINLQTHPSAELQSLYRQVLADQRCIDTSRIRR